MWRSSSSLTISPSTVRAGCVEHLDLAESQDDGVYVGHCGQVGEEALRGAEEEGTVEAVDEDVVVEQ